MTPELDGDGQETGFFNVTAGERRPKALLRLVKDKPEYPDHASETTTR